MIEIKNEAQQAKLTPKESTPVSILKLLKKINQLLNENNYLRLKNKELEKIQIDTQSFLKDLTAKNPFYKKAQELLSDSQARLDRIERKENKSKTDSQLKKTL